MGKYYDGLLQNQLPANANLADYANAASGSNMATVFASAKTAAGPAVINVTLIIPVILTVAFAGLTIYMKQRKAAA